MKGTLILTVVIFLVAFCAGCTEEKLEGWQIKASQARKEAAAAEKNSIEVQVVEVPVADKACKVAILTHATKGSFIVSPNCNVGAAK